jgi:hypothetical protein
MNLLATVSVSDTPRRLSADPQLEDRDELGVDHGVDVEALQAVRVVE